MLQKIDHIGIAVHSISKSRIFYENVLGLVCEKEEVIRSQKVKTAFFKIGEIHLELLQPTDEASPIAKFLETKGEGFHHIAYKTDDIKAQLVNTTDHGCTLIHEVPFTGAGGKEVAFIHPKSSFGLLTEFCSEAQG